jgi:hypothetical protein
VKNGKSRKIPRKRKYPRKSKTRENTPRKIPQENTPRKEINPPGGNSGKGISGL